LIYEKFSFQLLIQIKKLKNLHFLLSSMIALGNTLFWLFFPAFGHAPQNHAVLLHYFGAK